MKIGPFEIKKFAAKSASKGEIGGSGTTVYEGVISDIEYNSTLDTSHGGEGLTIYERMRKSDPVVKSTLKFINLLILQGEFYIEPASEDSRDNEIKEFVEEALFEKMTNSWAETLENILTYLPFGFSVFEKVFKIEDNKVLWEKFAIRLQTSIRKFEMDNGQPGIQQVLIGKMLGRGGEEPSIPMEKLLIFTNEKEGDNLRGVSILRAAYKPWFFKENAEKIDMIGLERQAIGVPVFKMPSKPTPDDVAKAEEIGENLRANEKAHVLLPHGWELDILKSEGKTTREADPLIRRFNRDIYANMMAHFLDLGSSKTGSWALAKEQSNPFYLAVKAISNYIVGVFNKDAIPQLVDLNFDNVEIYPKLKVTGIDNIDIEKLSTALQRLVMSNLLLPDEQLEDYLRDAFRLPEKLEPEKGKPTEKKKKPPEGKGIETETEKKKKEEEKKILKEKVKTRTFTELWRPKTMAEEKVNFRSLQRHFDDKEEMLAGELQKILSPQIDSILDKVRLALETGDSKRVNDIIVTFKEEVRQQIISQLKDSFNIGKASASNELNVLAPKNTTEMINMMTTRADVITSKLTDDLINRAKLNTLAHIEKQTPVDEALTSLRTLLEDQIVRSSKLTSSHVVVGGMSQGRLSVFDLHPDKIHGLQRSEILDHRVCNFCLSLDGRVIELDDPLARHDQFHFNCRGIWVAIGKEETDKPEIGGVPRPLRDRIGTLDEFRQIATPRPLGGSLAEEFIESKKV